jgi:hypothetical protein
MLAARLSASNFLVAQGFTRWLSGLISIARTHRFNQLRIFGKLLAAILARGAGGNYPMPD